MTDLSTGRLRELLDNATTGPWSAVHDGGADDTARILAKRTQLGKRTYLGISHGADADLMALAPELAEEVIRLREDLRHYLDDLNAGLILCESDTPLTASQVGSIAYDLTRILEGDAE